MIQGFIDRFKRLRMERFLQQTFRHQYAFVGMGQHSLSNLYPVIRYLGVPLKYVCVTSEQKAQLIGQKFRDVKATASLDEVLSDESVRGVFVAASPAAHFTLASKVLRSGKSLFIEKPPCMTADELEQLVALQQQHAVPVAMAGLQKRYGPAVQLLKKAVRKERLVSYNLHYRTGAYPEGDALSDLYIHPLDLVTYLFGKADVIASQEVAPGSYCVMLRHEKVTGMLELSTVCTWTDPEEQLQVCTLAADYRLRQMEELTRQSKPTVMLGIPMEKVFPERKTVEYLYARNNFVPTQTNNQIVSQGFFNEVSAFVEAVEGRGKQVVSSLDTLRDTYTIMAAIRKG